MYTKQSCALHVLIKMLLSILSSSLNSRSTNSTMIVLTLSSSTKSRMVLRSGRLSIGHVPEAFFIWTFPSPSTTWFSTNRVTIPVLPIPIVPCAYRPFHPDGDCRRSGLLLSVYANRNHHPCSEKHADTSYGKYHRCHRPCRYNKQ